MNNLSPEVLAQLFAQDSTDPFLALVTLTHEDFDDPIRLVNNVVDIASRAEVYTAFPMKIRIPVDDGETARNFVIDFDNVSLMLVELIRTVTSPIGVKIEMILASMPDDVQISQEELLIQNITYNKNRITATIVLDTFLNTEVTSERYNPANFPGLFG